MTRASIQPHTEHPPARPPLRVDAPARARRVTGVLVTWNKPNDAAGVVRALRRQRGHEAEIDLIVVDNASEPEARARLIDEIGPTRLVINESTDPAKPRFTERRTEAERTPGIGSITLIENAQNLGGCGGFNTGMRYAAEHADTDFLWLLDDDIDLPEDALASLIRAAGERPDAALIGSRTVDISDRATTIETTIFAEPSTGLLGPDPDPSDPRRAAHDEWRRSERMTGIRDVDVVSACSMLVRWDVAREVGFWDDRFFLYCDDADWCLRIKQAGHAVVLDLGAVVYHTPWFEKLSPTRAYYAQRNIVWTIVNSSPTPRRLIARRLAALLRDAALACRSREYQRAAMLLRTCEDAAKGRGGKLSDEPKWGRKNVAAAFVRAMSSSALAVLAPSRIKGAV